MKYKVISLLLAAMLFAGLTACEASGRTDENALTVAATTYPVYLFATAVTEGVDGVSVELMVNQPTSCLHDYTLTMRDMKVLDRADVIVMNGAGLEDFLTDALSQTDAPVIDCSAQVELLPDEGHEDHDHGDKEDGHYDPHFWLSVRAAAAMLRTIADGLSTLDPDHGEEYGRNLDAALARLPEPLEPGTSVCPYLVTFHDGFRYFAAENGLTILKAVEEEEGAEASAADIREILALIGEYRLPAIFTEANGSDATAKAIAWETGCKVYTLDMMMSGAGTGLDPWLAAMEANRAVIQDALSGP